MSLQVTWAPNNSTYSTFGRTGAVTPHTPAADVLYGVSGTSVYSATPPPTTFVHPGVLLGLPQLDFVKAKLAAGAQPWTTQYNRMMAAKNDRGNSANVNRLYSDLSWVPTPWALVGRGSGGNPSEGDEDEQCDAIAAYLHALNWYYKGSRASAQKAIQICNAWSSTLQDHKFLGTAGYGDGLLQSGWTGSMWPRSAEILRYTFTPTGSETALDATGFAAMLQRAHIPRVRYGWSGSGYNWLAVMADALIACAVYCEDDAMYQQGLANWRQWITASIWMTGDVNRWPQLAGLPISPRLPSPPDITPPGWNSSTGQSNTDDRAATNRATYLSHMFNPTSFPDGLELEMGRDPWHMSMGFAAFGNAAETARLQGDDLYGEQQTRLSTSVEMACDFIHNCYVDGQAVPYGMPFSPTSGTFSAPTGTAWGARPTDDQRLTWSILYNHFHSRIGLPMTQTGLTINDYVMNTSFVCALHMAFEGLTHTGTP